MFIFGYFDNLERISLIRMSNREYGIHIYIHKLQSISLPAESHIKRIQIDIKIQQIYFRKFDYNEKNIFKFQLGVWCSGITFALLAKGPGFNPRRIHFLKNYFILLLKFFILRVFLVYFTTDIFHLEFTSIS